jgi:hypothetical protein
MGEQQFLRKHASRRVDRQIKVALVPTLQLRGHVRKEGGCVCAGFVAVFPEIALQVFEVGDFDVSLGEVFYVGLEGLG